MIMNAKDLAVQGCEERKHGTTRYQDIKPRSRNIDWQGGLVVIDVIPALSERLGLLLLVATWRCPWAVV